MTTELKWSGRAVFWPSSGFDPTASSTLWMIADDAGTEIWSQTRDESHEGKRGAISARIVFEPKDEGFEVLSARMIEKHRHDAFSDAVADFLQMIGRTIVCEGEIFYELRFGADPGTDRIVDARFVPVLAPGARVISLGRHAIQILPPALAKERKTRRIISLRHSDTFCFRAPPRWRRCLKRLRRACPALDSHRYRTLHEAAESVGVSPQPLLGDPAVEQRRYTEALGRLTSPIGWTGRGLFSEYTTDFSLIRRLIRWKRFCSDLRWAMMNELRRAFERLGEQTGSASRVRIEQTDEAAILAECDQKLTQGTTSFVELIRSIDR